jgi:hypothetical protein
MNIPQYQLTNDRELQVYIAGPITGIEGLNAEAFKDAEEKIRAKGYLPVLPHDLFDGIDDGQMQYDNYIEGCVSALALCPTIVMLPGWENSRGANIEVNIARIMQKKIIPFWNIDKELPTKSTNQINDTNEY